MRPAKLPTATVLTFELGAVYDKQKRPAEAEAALQAGAHAYIVKPDIDGLLRTIARLLDKAGKGADPALFLFN